MRERFSEQLVRGNLLSCYTASIATYMDLAGIDYSLALGTQLFLAVQAPTQRQEMQLRFMHYHTPLRGETPTYSLFLQRQVCPSFSEAIQRIASELQRSRVVIVVGDAFHLPWQVNYQRQHAPHWFLITAIDEQKNHVYIIDAFEYINVNGSQGAFSGWVEVLELAALVDLDLTRRETFQGRERYAFSDDDTLACIQTRGMQWFEASAAPTSQSLTQTQILHRLAATCLFHSGIQIDAALARDGWVCGRAALLFLAETVQAHLDSQALFTIQDDLWVASRNREFFATVLSQCGERCALPALSDLAHWCQKEIVGQWAMLIQVMEYNHLAVRRGKRPRTLAAKLLQELAALEYELTLRLAAILHRDGHIAFPSTLLDATTHESGISSTVSSDVFHQEPAAETMLSTPEYVAPRTPDEYQICVLWATLLKVERVGRDDNFLRLGGNSLMAVQLISRLRDVYHIELPLFNVKEIPTVAELAQLISFLRQSEGAVSTALPVISRRIERNQDIPLSFMQQRLWFLYRMEPESVAYTIPLAFHIEGPLNVFALRSSLNKVVQRHETLRTLFFERDGLPRQQILQELLIEVPVVDLRSFATLQEKEALLQQAISTELQTPFSLTTGPLFRAKLLHLAEEEYMVLITVHHVVFDGWSSDLLLREVGIFYTAFVEGVTEKLPDLPIQYADFACWQEERLQGDFLASLQQYWSQQLKGAPSLLDLPTDRRRPVIQSYHGASRSLQLTPALSQSLKDQSLKEEVTLFVLLLATFAVLLSRYSGQEDICIGTPIANRNHLEFEDLIGYFADTLVLRVALIGNPTFRQFLQRLYTTAVGAYEHHDLPFEKLVMQIQPVRNLSYSPIFQVMFVLQNTPSFPLHLPGLRVNRQEVVNTTTRFDLVASVTDTVEGLRFAIDYNTDLFEEATVARLLSHWQQLLTGIVTNPDCPVSLLPLLTSTEWEQQVREWNQTLRQYPDQMRLHALFERQVNKTAHAVAIVYEDQSLSYEVLNQRANQLANHLRSLGSQPDMCIGICIERSLELHIGLLGILKAGCAYVPLDPRYPPERLDFILKEAQISILLTQVALSASYSTNTYSGRIIFLDEDWPVIACESNEPPSTTLDPDTLAYVIYTSGSTGQPKGVMISHRSICNHLLWRQEAFPLTETDRALQKTSISFDASAWEIFWPLCIGAAVILARPAEQFDTNYLANLIMQEYISVVDFVPSMLTFFLQEERIIDCEHLRHVFSGSEALPAELQRRFYQRLQAQLHNGYGPTEATLGQAYWTCQPDWQEETIPIGRPTANMQLYVLDAYLQPVSPGVTGELYIAGTGLARGYLHNPAETAQKFLPNPFSLEPGARLYKTGDLARYRPDGTYEFVGRADQQHKIRGFRIELGEIEAALHRHSAVQDTIVVIQEEQFWNKQLVAYIVPISEAILTVSQLRAFLTQKLPDYMIPMHFIFLLELPLMPNGKVDRQNLPTLPQQTVHPDESFVSPDTTQEKTLATIWENVLNLEKVGIHDNFFTLGGHSLLALQVISRIRTELMIEVSVRTLFQNPTIATLSDALAASKKSLVSTPKLTRVAREHYQREITTTGEARSYGQREEFQKSTHGKKWLS